MSNDGVPTNLIGRLREIFAIEPAAVAIEFEDCWYTYAEMARFCDALDKAVLSIGATDGLAVGVVQRNRPAHLAATLAILRSRHCVVTINPQLPPGPLEEDLLQLALPIIIADEEDWANPALRRAAMQTGSVALTISSEAGRLSLGSVSGLEQLSKSPHRQSMPNIAIEMLSSGTTGKPKRIKLSLKALEQSLYSASKAESRDPSKVQLRTSVQLQWLPLAHIGGVWNALYALYNGRRIALLERFDVDKWHALLLKHRPKFANFPPSALRMITDRSFPKEDFSSLIAIRTGTAPLDPELATLFEERYQVPVLQAYGATEFAGGVAGWTLADHRQYSPSKRKSVGRANPGVELRIVDASTFVPLPIGTHGLLEVRTSQVGDGKSWVRTTDIASIDEDGFLYIYGRSDNAINRGGFKVIPEHVESTLRFHPSIYEASVVGIAHARLGQVPVAAIQLQPGVEPLSSEALEIFLRERLKPYEIPVEFRVVAELPRTGSLKVSQPAVRALFEGDNR